MRLCHLPERIDSIAIARCRLEIMAAGGLAHPLCDLCNHLRALALKKCAGLLETLTIGRLVYTAKAWGTTRADHIGKAMAVAFGVGF